MRLATSIKQTMLLGLVGGVLLPGHLSAQQSGPPRLSNPGSAYTVSASGAATTLGGATGAPATLQNYIGHVVFAAGRGRMDIVEGGVPSLFNKGDYLLFDSVDVIVVHPAAREFLAIPRDLPSRSMEHLAATGIHIAVADEKATLDSISAGDSVAGLPTTHFRMTVAFNVAMDAGVMQQRLGTESITDYWVSSSPLVPPNPLLRSNGFAAGAMNGGMFHTLSAKVDSVSARMGTSSALKTRSVTRLLMGPGSTVETQQVYEISNIVRRDVDDNLLLLPAGLAAATLPGVEATPAALDSLGVKWRAMPGARAKLR